MANKNNKTKQDIKEKVEVVKQIFELKNINYDEWLLEKLSEIINQNVSFLIGMVNKKSEATKENIS
ncbi:hypothetical protein [Clostridium saccharoperbutylacetonicum]|uniref:hypothetical protein n=1 Tax=Clostridium saccharoperbutylacetonicum TaxID=36745 RepID=UPI0039E8764C